MSADTTMTTTWAWQPAGLPAIGVRPVDPDRDAPLLHRWLTHPRSHWWQLTGASPDEIRTMYREIGEDPAQAAWLGTVAGCPAFLIETYAPARLLAGAYAEEPGDLGMHLLVAPPEGPRLGGFTDQAMAATLRFCFDRLQATRIVVEPDVRNWAIQAKNAAAGFAVVGEVDLGADPGPPKRALLSLLTAKDFAASRLGRLGRPAALTGPITDDRRFAKAQRLVLAKAIAEFAHEFLIRPIKLGPCAYELIAPTATWRFTARRLALNHWIVDPGSIERLDRLGCAHRVEAAALILDLRADLGIPANLLPLYLEELNATVAARARTLDPARPTVAQLLTAGLATVESAMAEGHPSFVATNGRTGFTQADHAAYAPEQGVPAAPVWVAVRRAVSEFRHTRTLTGIEVRDRTLGRDFGLVLDGLVRAAGGDPHSYHYLPVHPWQWQRHLGSSFAPDIARGDILPLCVDPRPHRPQQSIRTWLPHDGRAYVKMALAIQNMGFLRGLSPAYLAVTPAINDWVAGLVRRDPELTGRGFDVLSEFASIGYTGDDFHRIGDRNSHTKLLAALWRENPEPQLAAGERAITMAALLHRDPAGRAYAPALIADSHRSPAAWLRGFLEVTLWPILHLIAHHRLAFMPHGENIILRLDHQFPVGAWLKDIGEEAALFDPDQTLPEEVERIRCTAGDAEAAQVIFTDVFDGFLRFLSAILDQEGTLPAGEFWAVVRTLVADYVDTHPEARRLDLFVRSFSQTCLNRLQLRNTLTMVDLADQVGSLIRVGRLANPLARVPIT